MKKIRDIFSGNEGFTLIELLIVIVIIGVLAAIAIPNIANLGSDANFEAARANMRTLMVELESKRAQQEDLGVYGSISDNYNGAAGIGELENVSLPASGNVTWNPDPTSTDYGYDITISVGNKDIRINNGSIKTTTNS